MSSKFATLRPWKASLDTIGSGIGLLFAILLFPLQFFVSSIYLRTVPVVIGTASALYLLTRRYESGELTNNRWRFRDRIPHALRMATMVALAGMLFVGTYTGGRTIPFFFTGWLVVMLIFTQIFFIDKSALHPTAILLQIVALALILRGVALLSMPGFIGIDSWTHLTNYASSIKESGKLSAIVKVKYYMSPLYHLLLVAGSELFNASLRATLYATLGIVMPLSVLLIYFTTRLFVPVRWALFATAAYSVGDQVIRWGLHIIPTSMGLLFFLGICYGVSKIYVSRVGFSMYILILLLGIGTILTHQVSMFIVLVFLAVGTVVQLYARVARTGGDSLTPGGALVNFVVLFAILLPLTLFNWQSTPMSVAGPSFLGGMLSLTRTAIVQAGFLELSSASTVASGSVENLLVKTPVWVEMLNTIGFLILLLVALLGSFTLLHRSRLGQLPLTWIIATGVMLFVTLGLPLLGLYFLIPARWYAFMYVPMVILGAYGLRYLELNVPARPFVIMLVVFLLLFPGPMIINHTATRDNPVFNDNYHRYAFSTAEIDATATIASIHPNEETLSTDQPYWLLFRDWQQENVDTLSITAKGSATGDHVVYRSYQTAAGPQVKFDGSYVRVQLARDDVCRPSMNVVYSNGEVQYCRAS